MATAQQIADLQRHIRKLEPHGEFTEEYLTNLLAILGQTSNEGKIVADQNFNNDDTLADLAGLASGTLKINTTYIVDILLRIESVSSTPGAELKFVIPAGATLKWALGSPADVSDAELTEATTAALLTLAGIGIVTARGILTMGATAGVIQAQGAQATATVEDTDYKVGSALIVREI